MPRNITINIPLSRLRDLYEFLVQALNKFSITHLALISLAMHLFVIPFPQDGTVFDEKYYTQAGLDLINGVASNAEHPFLGKLWGSIGILLFGNNWFGWRISSVIFGTLALVVFFRLASLFVNERRALYASTLLAFDNIFFIHSSLYLLEVPALFFSLSAFYLYFRRRYKSSAVAMGLGLLSKETAAFFLMALVIYHLSTHAKRFLRIGSPKGASKQSNFRGAVTKTVTFVLILLMVTAVPIWVYDYAYKPASAARVLVVSAVLVDEKGSTIGTTTRTETTKETIENPLAHLEFMLRYQTGLTIGPGSIVEHYNYAWNWILPPPPKEMVYYDIAINKNISNYADGRLVSSTLRTTHPIHWAGIGNIPLWVLGFWIVIPFSAYSIILSKRHTQLEPLILAWVTGTYLPYLILSLVVRRIVYPFYFIDTVPILALGLAALGSGPSQRRTVRYFLALLLISVLIWFLWYFPVRVTEL